MSYRHKIAVTGAGGGVGQSVIKSLYHTDYDIVALDGEVLGTGLYAAPKAYTIPYSSKDNFIPVLLDICKKEKCSLLFPGLDAELMVLSKHRQDFAEIGTTVVVSNEDVILASDDKQVTYDRLTEAGLLVPKTVGLEALLNKVAELEFPVIVKQKVGGARSKNVFLLRSMDDLLKLREKEKLNPDHYIAQEYIEGDEYTCGSVNLGGECKGVIVMRRILRDGDTYKCFSLTDSVIEDAVRRVMNTLKPFGACNVQLRMKNGKPYIFEINARCSGTTASRTLCGFNEPGMIADFLLRGIEPAYKIEHRTVLRYWKELVVENHEVDQLRTSGHLSTIHQNLL
jgi:carbamoyl-phosphate synthase large subunit